MPDVHDRCQTDVRQKHRLMPIRPMGWRHNKPNHKSKSAYGFNYHQLAPRNSSSSSSCQAHRQLSFTSAQFLITLSINLSLSYWFIYITELF